MSNQNKFSAAPFDSEVDHPVELDELNFSDDDAGDSFVDLVPPYDNEITSAELDDQSLDNEPAMPGDDPTSDDLSPETLIKEDGALSPHEPGDNSPIDKQLTIVDADEIGAGYGLDEAELARVKPLDGKRDDRDN